MLEKFDHSNQSIEPIELLPRNDLVDPGILLELVVSEHYIRS